ncbi:MAG: 3-oxoacyl-ACP synthase III [Deltaproteobacteria bacterium]|jgi:3-oxoacyl-[acyl-carrier-protein] synthase-3|nr:3-oxoacyl-ACP synthase III [Deltaproteobacteria bacterium]
MRRQARFENSAILAWARDEGPESLSTGALESTLAPLYERIRVPLGTIPRMTGIGSRDLYPGDSPPSRGAILAAGRLMEGSGLSPLEIDLLYSTSVGRDFLEPSTASVIQAALGLGPRAQSLDLGSACLGFLDGLALSALQLENGIIDHALVVAGENARRVLTSTVRALLGPGVTLQGFFGHFATLTLGSGGAAMLVGKAERYPHSPRMVAMASLTDPASNDLCRGDESGMWTDPAKLLEKGVALAARTFEEGRLDFGWEPKYFDLVISHQVSEANTRRFSEALGIPWERILKTYPQYGNMGPVAIPFAFDLAFEQGLIRPGSRVALMGIGSGLACSMLELWVPEGFKGRVSFQGGA